MNYFWFLFCAGFASSDVYAHKYGWATFMALNAIYWAMAVHKDRT